mmetsp:Transcript_52431/g.118059  ORF Transcript_52431/g.118059 Transcript_52431/m.118059 type:complete len:97 (-) Transcript_52431:37-327(-)
MSVMPMSRGATMLFSSRRSCSDDDDAIKADELVGAILRLRESSKYIDIMALQHQVEQSSDHLDEMTAEICNLLDQLRGAAALRVRDCILDQSARRT